LNADSEYVLAGTVSLGESADVEFNITTAGEPAPIGEIAPDTVEVETWFTPNAESLSSCVSADGPMIAVALSGPTQPVARVLLLSTSQGHRALFVGAGESLPDEAIFLRATDAVEPVFLEIDDVDGGRLAPFQLPATEMCFDGPAAAEAPTSAPPDTGLVYPDAIASVALACADLAVGDDQVGDEAGCSQGPGRPPVGAALSMLVAVAMRRRRIGCGRPPAGRLPRSPGH
jgi:hypothetical protein